METQMEKVSYILGRQVGGDLKNQGLDITPDLFFNGLKSALNGDASELDEAQTMATMEAFQKHMAEKLEAASQELAASGLKYLEENKSKEGVITTDTGLQYKVLETGSGKTPANTDTVEVNYEGKLIDGTVFDSSYARGQSISFPVNGVIAGWTEALQLMKEGDVWELTIPSVLGYGARGAGAQIPPHATLIFKVELIAVK